MKTLITFLGRARGSAGTYARTTYRFDSRNTEAAAYFGVALARYVRPDRVIMLGTASSMWDVFLLDNEQGIECSVADRLIDAVKSETVDAAVLRPCEPAIERVLGCPVALAVIPHARDAIEQFGILARMADQVHEGDEIVLDVTHGFRHLPMIALAAARYLAKVRKTRVNEIFYGAWEMRSAPNDESPVLRLSGLLTLLDWVDALASFDKDGDYGVFAPLLEAEGIGTDAARSIQQAAFFERTNNPVKARESVSGVTARIESLTTPNGGLFRAELLRRMDWFRAPRRDQWELGLADACLGRGDFLRAALLMQEARVSRGLAQWKPDSLNDVEARAKARDSARQATPEFHQLASLRNALAHGVRTHDDDTAALLRDEHKLASALGRIRANLF